MKKIAFALIFVSFFSCQPETITIYVSPDGHRVNPGTRKLPVGTIEQAQQVVQEKIKSEPGKDIRVLFSRGTYSITNTIQIENIVENESNAAIYFEGIAGQEIIFSGGSVIKGWIEEDGLWKARLDKPGKVEQLFVDGKRATRARIPNVSEDPNRWYIDSVYTVKEKNAGQFLQVDLWLNQSGLIPDINQNGESEIVIYKDWATLRHKIAALNPLDGRIALAPPFAMFDGNYNGIKAPYVNRFTCYLEGNKAFIDQPGEWAFDLKSKSLYYKPFPDQELENTEFIIPNAERLISIKGNPDQRVSNIHFSNIQFKHSAYYLPDFGHDGRQACFYYSDGTGIPGDEAILTEAIRLEWAENCSFENCKISQTGGNGIYLTTGCQNISLDRVELADIGGNGIMIGTAIDPGLESEALVKGISFTNGLVTRAGKHYDSAVGIWLGFCRDCSVSGNDVYDLPYTGISVGWQWNPVSSSSGGNLIEGNHIYQVMQMLGDGGGIYTLGFQPGSIIRGNIIHDILRSELNHASPNNGMFIDEGSKGYLVENNHIYNVAHTCIRGHRAAGVELRNNKFEAGLFPAVSHTPPYGNMIFTNQDSTIIWHNPGWPKEWGYDDSVIAFTMNNNTFVESK